ncbi:MAG: hypothetical protein ABIP21_05210 [Acidimicrobiia bacterium]
MTATPLRRRGRLAVSVAIVAMVTLVAAPALADKNHGSDHGSTKGMKGMKGMKHSETGMQVITSALTGDSPCEKSGPPASVGQVKKDAEGHDARGPLVQYSVTRAEREQLIEQQRQARAVADKYPTVAAAEADGYKKSTVYVPCIGAHYTKTALVGRFDPATPSELLYDGTAPESKIVGLSYLLFNKGGPPEGFAGPNDQWHQHNANGGLCLNAQAVVVGNESTTKQECEARGGKKIALDDIWMVHNWVVPGWECGWGVFAGECPELGGRIGGTVFDAPDPKSFQKALDGKSKTASTKKKHSHKKSNSEKASK